MLAVSMCTIHFRHDQHLLLGIANLPVLSAKIFFFSKPHASGSVSVDLHIQCARNGLTAGTLLGLKSTDGLKLFIVDLKQSQQMEISQRRKVDVGSSPLESQT